MAESRLDAMLADDSAAVRSRGIEIIDHSARAYHYKNQTLSWEIWFESRRNRGAEIEKVTVRLSLDDTDNISVRILTVAEIFQPGQVSRWHTQMESFGTVARLGEEGLAKLVTGCIEDGHAKAAAIK